MFFCTFLYFSVFFCVFLYFPVFSCIFLYICVFSVFSVFSFTFYPFSIGLSVKSKDSLLQFKVSLMEVLTKIWGKTKTKISFMKHKLNTATNLCLIALFKARF